MGFRAIVAATEELLTQSPTLCLANLAVLAALRYPVATGYHEPHPKFAIAGSSGDPLLDAVRTRLTTGVLFPVVRKSWAGQATGKCCAVCDLTISNSEIEYEVAAGPSGSAFAHLPCYLVWRQESEALRLT
jgi:hypothetical protein